MKFPPKASAKKKPTTTKRAKKTKTSESEGSDLDHFEKTIKDRKKTAKPKNANTNILPMLAHDYNKDKKHITYPCFVQPKLDGVRALFYNNKFYSRNGNQFLHLDHIKAELDTDIILDGELYTNEMPFEELVGLVKRQTKSGDDIIKSLKIKYIVYDYVNENDSFTKRNENLSKFFTEKTLVNTLPLITEECISESLMRGYHDKYVGEGYEGLILRNKSGLYSQKSRSHDLQKFKVFADDEFEIVDYKAGEGRDAEAVIWICKTKDGKRFNARPDGPCEERRKMYKKAKTYIGKLLTVKYQNLSRDGIPRFPIGITIRDYE